MDDHKKGDSAVESKGKIINQTGFGGLEATTVHKKTFWIYCPHHPPHSPVVTSACHFSIAEKLEAAVS